MINSIPHLLAAPVSGHRSGSMLSSGGSLAAVAWIGWRWRVVWLWVELLCMEAVVDQEDTSHNHSRTEVEDLRRRTELDMNAAFTGAQAGEMCTLWIDVLPYIIIIMIISFNYCLTCSLCLINRFY